MQLELCSTGLARLGRTAAGVYLGMLLAACGGGGGGASTQALDTVTLELSLLPLSQAVATQVAQPMVQVSGTVVVEPMANAYDTPTYSPAQVRSAYEMAALPDWRSALTPAQSASLGAGQTVYLINAYHDTQIAQELAAFNDRFGLPPCRVTRMAPPQALPLPAASASGCELLLVASTSAGDISTDVPGYVGAWASEAALDVQWAHATAPLARLVLIEAPNAALSSMLGAIKLANKMGPGVVSMSFGCAEGPWTDTMDTLFSSDTMSYLAATGDDGPELSWPAVSPRVLAVGGTTLRHTQGGARAETSWSATGGGFSAYTAAPSYQNGAVLGLAGQAMRSVADVALNADPITGQYVARIAPGATLPTWVSAGGTSLATVQWAGLLAVANAQRALAGKPVLGAPHAVLYGQIAALPGAYAAAFGDISSGANGNCASCAAKPGYDTLSGLGTPKVEGLLALLSQTQAITDPVTSAKPGGTDIRADVFSATAGQVFEANIAFSDPSASRLTVTISGVPKGVEWSVRGTVVVARWTNPRAGSYPLVVAARNDLGQTAQANLTFTVR